MDPNDVEYAPLGSLSSTFGLDQHIWQPTHRTRCIDLCFTGAKITPVIKCSLLDPIERDHAVVSLTINSNFLATSTTTPSYPRPIYSKACWPLVRRFLAESGLLNIAISAVSVEEACSLWASQVREVIRTRFLTNCPSSVAIVHLG
ncbi:MAG: hypothetical protein GY820_02290 [Gammaproteobacteria bacterium]|nr:hypothetical protein [Gammaproteobacteria bacterium]